MFSNVKVTEMGRTVRQLSRITGGQGTGTAPIIGREDAEDDQVVYDVNDDMTAISSAVASLGLRSLRRGMCKGL